MGLLNRNNLGLAKLAPADDSKYTLSGILVEPSRTIVTDGHYLVIVATPNTRAEDFPAADGYKPIETFEPFILPKKAALDILKVLPTAYQAKVLPVLGNVAVAEVTAKSEDTPVNKAVLYATDLETHSVFQCRTLEGRFPNWRAVLPDPAKATAHVGLSVELTAKIFAELKAMGVKVVEMRSIDAESPVRFDGMITDSGQHVTVILMPYQLPVIEMPAYEEVAAEPNNEAANQPVSETTMVAQEAAESPAHEIQLQEQIVA